MDSILEHSKKRKSHLNSSGVSEEGEELRRPYTPVSPVTERGYLDFALKVYQNSPQYPSGGKLSRYIGDLEVGDSLEIDGPVGKFKYLGKGRFEV